jgi:hypothetical protein
MIRPRRLEYPKYNRPCGRRNMLVYASQPGLPCDLSGGECNRRPVGSGSSLGSSSQEGRDAASKCGQCNQRSQSRG